MMAGYARSESNYIDSIQGISAIKSLGWHESIIGRNKSIYANFQEKVFSLGKIKISLGILTGIIGTLYLVMVLIYISVQVFRSMMSEGELLAVLSISSSLVPSILNLALVAIPVSEARVAVERMFEFSRIEPEESEVPDEMSVSTTGEIRLENISFRYPGRPLLLRNIGLTIEKGKVVSLVGESGCGKSTLANILLRFYDAESGRIMVNGHTDSGSISLRQWRALTGIVPQEIHIFNGTILQNLIAGYGEEEIRCLAGMITALGLDKFIDSFPSGIMTLIGEEGINLSGGQRQLIAFIRALIKKPEILVIDEGTSGMDRGTESIITDLLRRLKKETGILLISHRINTIRDISDRIYVMEDKSIVAEGSHDELMQFDNLYKRFWDDFH
jgi:ATP-binding cassette subfamily B protein